jgi:hypothetical protein
MSKNILKTTLAFFFFALMVSCGDEEDTNLFEDLESDCSSSIRNPVTSVPLSIKVDNSSQNLNEGYFSMYINDTLYVGGENKFYAFQMMIPSPELGVHEISNTSTVEATILDYSTLKYMSANCGALRIDKFDINNTEFEAFFHFTASTPSGDAEATIYDGAVNGIDISLDPFCSRNYSIVKQSESLDLEDNYWALAEILDSNNDPTLLPPCDRVITLRYTTQNNQLQILGPGTKIVMGLSVDGNSVTFSDFNVNQSTATSESLINFQNELIAKLKGNTMTYSIKENELTLNFDSSGEVFHFYHYQ